MSMNDPLQELTSQLTDQARHPDAPTQILSLFERLEADSNKLAEELLGCYEQLNCAFGVLSAVAECTTAAQAIAVLTDELGRAVDCQFTYYLGHLPGSGPLESRADRREQLYRSPRNPTADDKTDFWQRHTENIKAVITRNTFCAVATIGYQVPHGIDHDGRGNVMVLQVSADSAPEAVLGHIVLVRSDGHDLFAAVEMNLASSLVKAGTAVLDNRIYADRLEQGYLQTITSLVRAIEAKDAYTSGHSGRVAALACKLAETIGLQQSELRWLEWAGLLHDIGKIGISDRVLTKPGKLDDQEFAEIKSHPTQSVKVIEPVDVLQPVLLAVKHHHEHFDGSGYPDGLTGEEIPLAARILQIADVWDALTSKRSYRNAVSSERALDIMRGEAGSVLDPVLFGHFEELCANGQLPA